MGENTEKKKALEVAMSQIEKQFGKGSVMKLGEFKAMEVEAISTGALSLDIALGIGGVPRGRIIEVFGPESSGKTTLALHIIAEAQKTGGEAAFIDAEHALDPVYAKKLGVDIDNLIVSQPDTGEQALEITEALVRSGALDVIAEKKKALEVAMSQIEKQFGKGSVMKLGEFKAMEVEAISTGALSLDIALGIGGVPRGRIIEVFGPESSGKTTLALHIIAEAQKTGGEAAFIDAEHALDPVYAKKLGVDIDNLIVSQPDTGEQALEITEALVRSGALDVIVVDSVAALVPKAEIDGEMGDSHMGLQARLMSQALRKLAGAINKSKTVLIFINQLREKIGVMFGNPETTTGGRALKFYASVRMDIRKIEMIKQDGEVTGNRVKVKIIKNKVAPPFREAEFDILYGKGISKVGNILDMAVNLDIVEKSGAWFSYNGQRISQGRENAKRYLEEHADIMAEIDKKVRENFEKAFEQSLGEELPVDSEENTEPEE